MHRMRRRLLVGGVVLMTLGTLLFGVGKISAVPMGTLKLAIHPNLSADWLDPAMVGPRGASGFFGLYLIHDALAKEMPDGNISPCLAESWTISPDQKVYEFKLRQGVKFHNGDTMTADDVLFSFWRYKSSYAKLIQGKIDKAEAVNPHLVRFQFKEPFPDFLDYFSSGGGTMHWVVPKKYVEKVGEAGFKRYPIGAGPYKFVEFVSGVRLVGEAFDGFWRKVPNIKRIELLTIPDTATRLAMLRRGEVDVAFFMTDVFYEDVKKDPKLKLLHPRSPTMMVLNMTTQWDPKSPWSDARVRLAASLAIDRKTLADIHHPGTLPSTSIGIEGDPLAVEFPLDPYDPEKARKLLAEVGYPKGFHGGKFYPYDGPYRAYGEQLTTYWKAVGITVDTILLERPAWSALRNAGKLEGSTFIDTTAGTVGIARRLDFLMAACPSCPNYPDIKSLWDQYKGETNPEVRKDLIIRVQKMIHERRMFLPLNQLCSPAAFGPRVKGNPYKIQPIIWFPAPFEDIELEN